MEIQISSLRCSLQVALLGAITPNVRAIKAKLNDDSIDLLYFYDHSPSEDEEEMAEIVASEVFSDFPEILVKVCSFVIPAPMNIPKKDEGNWIYFRWEEPIPED